MATFAVSGLNSISSFNNNFRSKNSNIFLSRKRSLLFNLRRRRRSFYVSNVASDQKQKTKDSSSDEGIEIIVRLISLSDFNLTLSLTKYRLVMI